MAYADFTIDTVDAKLGIRAQRGDLFPDAAPAASPQWLPGTLARGMELALLSEKARSEFIVAPVLLAVRELSGGRVAILSGHRMDVDPARSLVGECDFILSLSDTLPRLEAPVVTVVEAKKNDIDLGLPQCMAQMVAARVFNERAGKAQPAIYGCVTTGQDWQFLALSGNTLTMDRKTYFITDVGLILGILLRATTATP